MPPDTPLLPPLDLLRSLDLRPILIDRLGDAALLAEANGIIFIDAGLTLHQLGEIAAQCLADAASQAEILLTA
ncbi:MAG: hypothetical protein ACOH10_08060 [Rhodoglobus sp.]